MPAPMSLYHEVHTAISSVSTPAELPAYSQERLALLVTGIVAADRCVLAAGAADPHPPALTAPPTPGRIERRARGDPHQPPPAPPPRHPPGRRAGPGLGGPAGGPGGG